MADKHIYDMNSQEAVDLINSEAKLYADAVEKDSSVGTEFFNTADWTDERLYDLYFAYKVTFDTEMASKIEPELERAFEPVEYEFNRRTGVDPVAGATAMGL